MEFFKEMREVTVIVTGIHKRSNNILKLDPVPATSNEVKDGDL